MMSPMEAAKEIAKRPRSGRVPSLNECRQMIVDEAGPAPTGWIASMLFWWAVKKAAQWLFERLTKPDRIPGVQYSELSPRIKDRMRKILDGTEDTESTVSLPVRSSERDGEPPIAPSRSSRDRSCRMCGEHYLCIDGGPIKTIEDQSRADGFCSESCDPRVTRHDTY